MTDARPLEPLAAQFAELAEYLREARTVADVLGWATESAKRVIEGADMASVTLQAPDGTFHTPIYAEPVAEELDQVQYRAGEGPCVSAARTDGPAYVRSNDLAHEPAWPTFGPAAAARGYTSVLSTALLTEAGAHGARGALNVYSARGHTFGDDARETALLLAAHAGLALSHTQAVSAAELRETQLREAIRSRDVIGQAKGILMARRGIDADQAFGILRRASQDLNIKLADLAATLAERHVELDLPEIE